MAWPPALTDERASFIGMAGTLFLAGFDGLAWSWDVLGLRPGCPVPCAYLASSASLRFPTSSANATAPHRPHIVYISAITARFVYVVAQIYASASSPAGLPVWSSASGCSSVSPHTGLLDAGGMRAVTWTQVAQYQSS